jgi:hypothetical protein
LRIHESKGPQKQYKSHFSPSISLTIDIATRITPSFLI